MNPNSISPYPEGVAVSKSGQVFLQGKYLGYVDKVPNWGCDFLARPEPGPNKFFTTQTEAVRYLLSLRPQVEVAVGGRTYQLRFD